MGIIMNTYNAMTRGLGFRARDGKFISEHSIEQRRLAGIWPTHNCYNRI